MEIQGFDPRAVISKKVLRESQSRQMEPFMLETFLCEGKKDP